MKKYIITGFTIIASFTAFSSGGYQQGMFGVRVARAADSAVNVPIGSDTSSNWAGYVASVGTFTSVGAGWTVPRVVGGNGSLSADATWVGIGGLSSNDLIQVGTQAIVQNGTTTYEPWYELLPASAVQIPFVVNAGDAVAASIAEQADGQWNISLSDTTTGQSYQTSVAYQSSLSSAEWIEEMPSDQRGFVQLDNFGAVSFINGFALQNGSRTTIGGSGAEPMVMTSNGGQVLAAPSSLGADAASFTVTRSSAAASSISPQPTHRDRWSRTGTGIQGYAPLPPSRPTQQQQSRSNERSPSNDVRVFIRNSSGGASRMAIRFFRKIGFRN